MTNERIMNHYVNALEIGCVRRARARARSGLGARFKYRVSLGYGQSTLVHFLIFLSELKVLSLSLEIFMFKSSTKLKNN